MARSVVANVAMCIVRPRIYIQERCVHIYIGGGDVTDIGGGDVTDIGGGDVTDVGGGGD